MQPMMMEEQAQAHSYLLLLLLHPQKEFLGRKLMMTTRKDPRMFSINDLSLCAFLLFSGTTFDALLISSSLLPCLAFTACSLTLSIHRCMHMHTHTQRLACTAEFKFIHKDTSSSHSSSEIVHRAAAAAANSEHSAGHNRCLLDDDPDNICDLH
jgi:hypothetical protein